MANYIFKTPKVKERPAGVGRLFSFYGLDKGITIVKSGGVYSQIRYPMDEVLKNTYTNFSKTNLIKNPNFEVNTTGWSTFNITQSRITSNYKFGTASNQIVFTVTAGGGTLLNTRSTTYSIPITVGSTYTATVYMKRTVGTRTGRIAFTARNAPNGSSVQTATGANTTISDTDWTRLTLSITITAPTATNLELGIGTGATGSIGDTFLIDGVMVVEGSDPVYYFDGTYTDIPANRLPVLAWTGTANDSTSTVTATFNTVTLNSGTPSLTDVTSDLGTYEEIYRGGYDYTVDDATRSALIAGSVGVTAANFTAI